MRPIRVAVLADPHEEGWPSMDLVADMLVQHLRTEHAGRIDCELVRPSIARRAQRVIDGRVGFGVDRVLTRMWGYPRLAADLRARHDVFHVVDHSYAQLVHHLPAPRTVVTCHDLDTFRSILEPGAERRTPAFRAMTRHILHGLRQAGHVACDSAATRQALVDKAGVPPERATVIHNGAHTWSQSDPVGVRRAGELLGPEGGVPELLHVGSTIGRKRIEDLLHIVHEVRAAGLPVRLVRAGGPFSVLQAALARQLGIESAIAVLPPLDRPTLAAVYRRAALLLLPSEREGFGLPLVEAMACGTPVVASDIGALREIGGTSCTYCRVSDIPGWRDAVVGLVRERSSDPDRWEARRQNAIEQSRAFTWSAYAGQVAAIYERLGGAARC